MDDGKIPNWFNLIVSQTGIQTILDTNQYTKQFGVTLSEKETKLLLQERTHALQEQERVEFQGGILPKLIFTFCDSPYIYQDNYVDTLGRLQEIFYLYKNESLDELSDDELLEYMKQEFNSVCQGSLDYLEDTCLEQFARDIRKGTHRFIGKYHEEDDV